MGRRIARVVTSRASHAPLVPTLYPSLPLPLSMPCAQEGLTPLQWAASCGRLDVVKALLGAFVDKEAKDKVGSRGLRVC